MRLWYIILRVTVCFVWLWAADDSPAKAWSGNALRSALASPVPGEK